MVDQVSPGRQYWSEQGAEERFDDPLSLFKVEEPLGRGSYGSVYRARVYETGEVVAVKVIPLTEQDEISSIQKEVALLRECNHPNIVKYYGSWRTSEALWIGMEYCAGGSLSDIMHACDCALDEPLIAYICSETLAGLSYLHSIGKLHRDIKCGNILLTESGEVKLADFGVAAQLTNTMSKRNTFIGTPHWMAPEVIQASHYDGKVDVWALGVTAIEMAERWPPRWKVNPNRVIFQIVKDPPPRLADKERWSLAFQDFVAQCLQKDANIRPSAKFLQQHKFVARDKATALRGLLPMVKAAREYSLQLAAAAAARAQSPATLDEGYWDPQGTMPAPGGLTMPGSTLPAHSPLHAPQQQQQQQLQQTAPWAYDQTLPAASPHFLGRGGGTMISSGGGGSSQAPLASQGGAVPAAAVPAVPGSTGGQDSGTFVVLEPGGGGLPLGYGTVRSSMGPSGGQQQNGLGPADSGTMVVHESPARPHTSAAAAAAAPSMGAGGPAPRPLAPPASNDYLAAVQAVAEGQASELDLPYMPLPSRGGVRAVPAQKAPKTEAQRVIDKLHSLYSSGAVVPLPFLSATDAAPLALLGMDRGPPHMPTLHLHQQQQQQQLQKEDLQWEAALAGVLAEASGNSGVADGTQELPPLVLQQVQSSPVLLNLATTLAHHKRLLAQAEAEAGWGEGAQQSRARAQLASKAEDLADTLRTILCL